MGQASSSTVVQDIIDITTNILTQATMDCSTTLTQTESIDIENSSNVDVNNINYNEYSSINTACVQVTVVDDTVMNDITEEVTQEAESIATGYSMNESDAETFIESCTTLSTTIAEQFATNCSQELTSDENITVKNSQGISVSYVNFDEAMTNAMACTMDSTAVNDAENDVAQDFDQSATAKSSGWGLGLLILIVIIMIVIGIAKGFKTLLNPIFLLFTGIVVLSSFCLVYAWYLWPYVDESDDVYDPEAAHTQNVELFFWFFIPDLILAAIAGFLIYRKLKQGDKSLGFNSLSRKKKNKTKEQEMMAMGVANAAALK